ncbi:NAD(P)H-binding protein [Actinomadura rubrisoli]|uniref:NmrA family transcriptional regulator n=1 Tax=Actinomadura rubrisoli TaxID=2530368 RepID=A0A4R5C4V2_9ACTN|nr:NAD(P)H-binding protein [Actinomadura rubrisoli]TDD94658.1 NmrA family transcriptional regulator [Actinomadura rubrisoli]
MIVVTAPTGQIGRRVVQHLLHAVAPVRVIVRDPARLPAGVREHVEVVEGSHGDREVVDKAFAGAESVFWLVPPDPRAAGPDAAYSGFSRPACAAFREQGVRRVVGVSALGRGTPVAADAGHVTAALALDDLIASTGVGYRALALPSFMDNMLRQAELIREQGMFVSCGPGDRRLPACATRDIAAAAADLLLDGSWSGVEEVPLLGPEDLSPDDMAHIMSEVLGRPVRHQQVPVEEFRAGLLRSGMSEAVSQGLVEMFLAKDAGLDDGVARTPQNSTHTTFRQWCEEELKPVVLA